MAAADFKSKQQEWLERTLPGAPGMAVSRLHEYAVGLIYDALNQAAKQKKGFVQIATPRGLSKNLLEGGSKACTD